MDIIQITQVLNKHTLKEIVKLEIPSWNQVTRIFPSQVDRDEPLQVWIDHLSNDGADLLDDPVSITASQAVWFLKDYCSRPKKEWGLLAQ